MTWSSSRTGFRHYPVARGRGPGRPMRGGLLHLRPRQTVRRTCARPGWHRHGGVGGPYRRAVRDAGRRAGVLLREPRRRDRRDAGPSRTARSTPIRSSPRAPPGCWTPRRAPGPHRPQPVRDVLAAEREAGGRGSSPADELWTAFVPVRRPLAVRGRTCTRTAGCRTSPRCTPSARDAFGPLYVDVLRRFDRLFDVADALRLGLAPGAGPGEARTSATCTWSCSATRRARGQAEVPGRLGGRHGRVRERCLPRGRRPPTARDLTHAHSRRHAQVPRAGRRSSGSSRSGAWRQPQTVVPRVSRCRRARPGWSP